MQWEGGFAEFLGLFASECLECFVEAFPILDLSQVPDVPVQRTVASDQRAPPVRTDNHSFVDVLLNASSKVPPR